MEEQRERLKLMEGDHYVQLIEGCDVSLDEARQVSEAGRSQPRVPCCGSL